MPDVNVALKGISGTSQCSIGLRRATDSGGFNKFPCIVELCDGLFISETLSLQSAGRQIVDEGLLKSTRLAVNIRVLAATFFQAL